MKGEPPCRNLYGFAQRSAADAIAAAIIAMQLEERVYGERKDNG